MIDSPSKSMENTLNKIITAWRRNTLVSIYVWDYFSTKPLFNQQKCVRSENSKYHRKYEDVQNFYQKNAFYASYNPLNSFDSGKTFFYLDMIYKNPPP